MRVQCAEEFMTRMVASSWPRCTGHAAKPDATEIVRADDRQRVNCP
jgi:hypothetical protein